MMPRCSLKAKMTGAVALTMIGALAGMAFFLFARFEKGYRENLRRQQFTLVSALAEEIDQKIILAQHALTSFAQIFPPAVIADPARLQAYLKRHCQDEPIFDSGLFVFSPTGTLLAGAPAEPAMIGKDFSFRPYIQETIARAEPQVSAPFTSAQNHGHPIVMFTAPLFGADGEIVAIFAGALDLLRENFLGRFGRIPLGETGYFYLYATDRTIIAHPDRSRILQRDVAPGVNRLFDAAIAGFEGTGETVTSRGQHVFSSFKKLRTRDWILAGNLPTAEAFAPVTDLRRIVFITLAVGSLLSLAGIWLLLHHLTAPLTVFIDRVRQMTADDEKRVPIHLKTRDEIGVLAAAFNALLDETQNRKQALQDNLHFHEALINTLPLPVYFKDRQGHYLGCNSAFESFLGRRKEELLGRPAAPFFAGAAADVEQFGETPLEIHEMQTTSAGADRRDLLVFQAPFTDSNGVPAGLIGAVLDITDRQRSEEALAEQKDFYENLLKNSPVPVFVLDREHRVLIWNRACAEMTGIAADAVLGTSGHWRAFYPQQRPCLADLVLDGSTTADAAALYARVEPSPTAPDGLQAEDWFACLGGEKRYVAFTATPIRNRQGETIAAIETLQDISGRKRMELELVRSRDFYLSIFEEFPALVWRAGTDAKCDFFNKTWLDFTGRSMEQELGDGWAQGVHPDDLHRCLNIYRESFDARRPFAMEYRLRRHDGQYRWMLDIGRPVHDLDHRFAGYLGSLFDITDRRQAVEQLQIFSRATEQSSSSIIITDSQGRIEYVNPAFTRLTGYGLAEIAGTTPRFLQSGATDAAEYRRIRETLAAGRVWQGDFYNRKKNGANYWAAASITPIANDAAKITHFVAVQEDVTEKKMAQESAYRRRVLREAGTEALHAFLRTRNLAETARILIESCTELLHAEIGFIAETGALKILAIAGTNVDPRQEWLEARLLALAAAPDQPAPVADATTPGHAGGATFANALLVPLQIAEETVAIIGLVDKPGGFSDRDRQDMHDFAPTAALIFQGVRSEQERQKAADHLRLVQKFEAIGQLAGGVAHDFNNLLTVINGYTSMLIRSLDGDEEKRHDAEAVLAAGQRAETLTRQLLAFSRKQVLKPEVLNLNELIAGFRKILLRLLREDIEVVWALADQVGAVKADPGQIEQILINLIVNARDAMPTGGRLEVATGEAILDEQFARSFPGAVLCGRYAMIAVNDTGIGMTEEVREKIFDPFFTTKEHGQGTGLGLSTVYGIVKQSGGYITVDSTPGAGSKFRIYLPLTDETAAPQRAARNERRLPAATETILLVEDEAAVLALTTSLLQDQGFTVLAADRPEPALQLAANRKIDLLVTDMVMPGMNGPDVAARLRATRPGLKVLFMSGYGEFHGRPTVESSAEQFLQKPFSPTSLFDKIFALLGRTVPPHDV